MYCEMGGTLIGKDGVSRREGCMEHDSRGGKGHWWVFREGCYLDMFRLLQISVGEGGLGKGFVDY